MARTKTKRKATDGELYAISQMYSLQNYLASHWLTHAFDWSTDQFLTAALPLVKRKGRHGFRRMPLSSSMSSPRTPLLHGDAGRDAAVRYGVVQMPEKTSEPWTAEDDERLQAGVIQHGEAFIEVAAGLPGKTSEQCSTRWHYLQSSREAVLGTAGVDEAAEGAPWTEDDDHTVLELYDEYGKKWRKIAECLPGRTRREVKKRWNKVLIHEARVLGLDVDSPPSPHTKPTTRLSPQPPTAPQLPLQPADLSSTPPPPFRVDSSARAVRSPLPRQTASWTVSSGPPPPRQTASWTVSPGPPPPRQMAAGSSGTDNEVAEPGWTGGSGPGTIVSGVPSFSSVLSSSGIDVVAAATASSALSGAVGSPAEMGGGGAATAPPPPVAGHGGGGLGMMWPGGLPGQMPAGLGGMASLLQATQGES